MRNNCPPCPYCHSLSLEWYAITTTDKGNGDTFISYKCNSCGRGCWSKNGEVNIDKGIEEPVTK